MKNSSQNIEEKDFYLSFGALTIHILWIILLISLWIWPVYLFIHSTNKAQWYLIENYFSIYRNQLWYFLMGVICIYQLSVHVYSLNLLFQFWYKHKPILTINKTFIDFKISNPSKFEFEDLESIHTYDMPIGTKMKLEPKCKFALGTWRINFLKIFFFAKRKKYFVWFIPPLQAEKFEIRKFLLDEKKY